MADAETLATPAAPTGTQSAAILLMLLGDEEAGEVLSRLDPQEVQHLGAAMFEVADVSEEQVEGVFDRFTERAKARTTIGFQAAPRIRSVMQHALGDRAESVLARITPPDSNRALDALRWMDARTVAGLIVGEHPQLAALVIAHLDAPVAAEVIQLLPVDNQPDIVLRVATLGPVTAEALEEVERILSGPAARAPAPPAAARGGASEVAAIMNALPQGHDQRIIRTLAKLDKKLAQAIEDEMFIFDNLSEVDDKNLGTLFRSVDNEALVVALKGASEPLRDRILGCMSARAAQSIRDEMNERGPMRLAEVQEAQKAILATARKLAEAGTISLGGKGDDYV